MGDSTTSLYWNHRTSVQQAVLCALPCMEIITHSVIIYSLKTHSHMFGEFKENMLVDQMLGVLCMVISYFPLRM